MKNRIIFPSLVALALFGACTNSTTVYENNGGIMRGNVALVDANGDTLTNYAGAIIQLNGTSFKTTSSTTGDWEIDNVPAGIYTIQLTKPGFDTLTFSKFAFRGVGTSYFLSTGIQALPQDSLVIAVTNTTEDSTATSYLGLLGATGVLSGPDNLVSGFVSFSGGGISQGVTAQLTNGHISNFGQGVVGYNEPPIQSGAILTVRSYVQGNTPNAAISTFQRATSPYVVVRTLKLP